MEVESKKVLVIKVPRANRRQRPVYIGQNPITGTYRRNYEGDYHCSADEVGRMLAHQAEEPADCRILDRFSLGDLDKASVKQYRQRFAARSPDHPWLAKDTKAFMEKLAAGGEIETPGKRDSRSLRCSCSAGTRRSVTQPPSRSSTSTSGRSYPMTLP